MIPAAFDYFRAHSPDEAFAHLQKHGADARVLAGGQSLIPAMRFRLARPAVLVDINAVGELSYLRIDGADAGDRCDRARQRHRARAVDRRAALEPHPRRVARRRRSGRAPDGHGRRQPVPQRSGRRLDGGRARLAAPRSWCAARAGTAPRPDRRVPRRQLHDRRRRRRDGARRRFPVPDDRTAGSYQKVERKVGDFATAAAAVQVSLNADGTIRAAGVALSAAGPCAVRVDEAERLLRGQKPTADADPRRGRRGVRSAARRRPTCAAASSTRRISPACSWRAACARRWRVWGCRHEGQRQSQRRQSTSATSSRARCSPTSCAKTAA